MQNIIEKNKWIKIAGGILISPFAAYMFNVLFLATLNLGTYLGTFLRHLYNLVVC